jgi:hypothetical protein
MAKSKQSGLACPRSTRISSREINWKLEKSIFLLFQESNRGSPGCLCCTVTLTTRPHCLVICCSKVVFSTWSDTVLSVTGKQFAIIHSGAFSSTWNFFHKIFKLILKFR